MSSAPRASARHRGSPACARSLVRRRWWPRVRQSRLAAVGGGGSSGSTIDRGLARLHRRRGDGAQGAQVGAVEQPATRRRRSTSSSTAATTARCRRPSPASPPGNYPDVAYEYGSSAAQLASQPKLVDLTDKVDVAGRATGTTSTRPSAQAATVDGKVVGVPALVDNLSLVYNKKLFARPQVSRCRRTTGPGRTSATAAKKLTNASTQTYGWAYVNDGSEDTVWRYLAMLWQAGGDLLNAGQHQACLRLCRPGWRRCSSCTTWPSPTSRSTSTPATATTSTCSTAARSRCSGPARGTCRASTPTSTTA